MVFDVAAPITPGYQVELHLGATTVSACVGKLYALVDNAGVEIKKTPRFLTKKQTAIVKIKTDRPIAFEAYEQNKTLGRVLLRAGGKTVAAGIILDTLA